MTGKDAAGNAVVIIERKFWANLTENQPEKYLSALGASGKLLFLAPQERVPSLKAELRKRAGGDARMKVVSWKEFIDAAERANKQNHDPQLESDLLQLNALCTKMDAEGMPPLSQEDLDPMNGRRVVQFVDIVEQCRGVIAPWSDADTANFRPVSSKYAHGFYFCMQNFFGCFLCYSAKHWHKHGTTPIWLWVQKCNPDRTFSADETIAHTLHHLVRRTS